MSWFCNRSFKFMSALMCLRFSTDFNDESINDYLPKICTEMLFSFFDQIWCYFFNYPKYIISVVPQLYVVYKYHNLFIRTFALLFTSVTKVVMAAHKIALHCVLTKKPTPHWKIKNVNTQIKQFWWSHVTHTHVQSGTLVLGLGW